MRWDSRVAIYYWGHPKDGQYASSFFIFYYYIPFFILPTGSLVPRLGTMSSLAKTQKWDYRKKV